MKFTNIIALLAVLSVLVVAQAGSADAVLKNVFNLTYADNITDINATYGNITQITQEPVHDSVIWYSLNFTAIGNSSEVGGNSIINLTYYVPDNRACLNAANYTISNGTNTIAATAYTAGDYAHVDFTELFYNDTDSGKWYNITFCLDPFTLVSNEFDYKSGMYNETWNVTNHGTDLNISKANITVTPRNYANMKTVSVYKTATAISNVTSVSGSMIAIDDLNSSYTLRVLYTTTSTTSSSSSGSSASVARPIQTIGTPFGTILNGGFLFMVVSTVVVFACIGGAYLLLRKRK